MTKLDKPLRREVQIGDKAYTLTIDPDGLKLVEKGHRKGVEVSWASLASGEGEGASQPSKRSEEHTSELQSLMRISYAVFCLKQQIPYQTHRKNTPPNSNHQCKSHIHTNALAETHE